MENSENGVQQLRSAPNQKYFVVPDKIYGNYKTIKQVFIKTPKCISTQWECLHIPSNEIRIRKACDLAKFITGEEQEKYNQQLVTEDKHQLGYRHSLYNYYKNGAKLRGIDFDLEYDEFINIIKKPCAYCGQEPYNHITLKTNKKQPPFLHNGIDRVEPDLGYTIKNCVPCCSKCNYMKHVQSRREFLDHIKKIYNYLELSEETT